MSGWLNDVERKRGAHTDYKKSDIEEVSNIIYQFISTVNRIEVLSKELNTLKDNESVRTRLRKAREKAKKESKQLIARLDSDKELLLKEDEKLYGKLIKQQKEIFERFQIVYRESLEKEKQRQPDKHYRGNFFFTVLIIISCIETEDTESVADDGSFNNDSSPSHKQKFSEEIEESRLVLSEYNKNVIETEKNMAKERLEDLKRLDSDMNDLQECFVNLKVLLTEQNEQLDQIEQNVDKANECMEEGIEDIRYSNNFRIGIHSIRYLPSLFQQCIIS